MIADAPVKAGVGSPAVRLGCVVLLVMIGACRPIGDVVVSQDAYHCGAASAETILRAYGGFEPWMDQHAIARAVLNRTPEYKSRHPEAADAWEGYYPDLRGGLYQPVLAEFLIDKGYGVISTKTVPEGDRPSGLDKAWTILEKELRGGRKAILHVPGHYMAVLGIEEGTLRFGDPRLPDGRFSVRPEVLVTGASFHADREGRSRPGWVGRSLAFGPGGGRNAKDRCPCCGGETPGARHPYCRLDRCFIDRRASNRVQLALDALADSPARDLVARGLFSEAEVEAALDFFPLGPAGDGRVRIRARER